ncbi:hypothetical protein AAFF_G00187330 [Aldrovandia affinis]|uniref:Uncharacterized protein n=1 Tax=Aldrovandia affinis TaxID=143900 RepID=A0AAD7SXZ5_9TELE|nr:hypothetical protein AAFF_G00187330 [Aldrovandia affinis]
MFNGCSEYSTAPVRTAYAAFGEYFQSFGHVWPRILKRCRDQRAVAIRSEQEFGGGNANRKLGRGAPWRARAETGCPQRERPTRSSAREGRSAQPANPPACLPAPSPNMEGFSPSDSVMRAPAQRLYTPDD